MAYQFDGSGDHIGVAKATAATDLSTFSVSCHYIKDAGTGTYREIAWSGGSWSDNFGWFIQIDGGLNRTCLVTNWSITRARWSVSNATDGVWVNDVWTYDYGSSGNDPICYRDGTSLSITENATPAGTARPTNDTTALRIGAYENGSAEYWKGKIAELAIWNRVLTAAEAAILGKGYSPLFIPNGLVFYAPMIRTVQDLKSGNSGTVTNAVVADHPRIIYPSTTRARRFTTASGGTTYTPTYTETMTLVDTLPRSISRTLTDVETLVDTVLKSTSRTLSDVVTYVDSCLKNPSRILSDVATLVDTIVRSTNKLQSEVMTLVDTYSRVWSTSRTLSEEVTMVDSVPKSTSRTLTDETTLVDTIIHAPGRILSEVVTLVDSIVRSVSRTLSEIMTLVDTLVRSIARYIGETITFVDSFVYDLITTSYSKTLSEVMSLSDSMEKLFNHIASGIPTTIRHLAQIMPFGFLKSQSKPSGSSLDDIKPEGSSGRGIESGLNLKDKNKPSMM